MLSPSISNDINIGVTPSFPINNAINTLEGYLSADGDDIEILNEKLVIFPNVEKNCEYKLAYRFDYVYVDLKTTWIDAHTSNILKTSEGSDDVFSVSHKVEKNSKKKFFQRFLLPPTGPIFIHNMGGTDCGNVSNLDSILTVPPTCPIDDTTPLEQTVLRAASCTVENLEALDPETNFNPLHIAVNMEGSALCGSASFPGSVPENGAVRITNGQQLTDIIAHEIGHTFINQFFFSNANEANEFMSRAVHEGFSDIIGEFIEFMCHGSTDFITFDVLDIDDDIKRDLSEPICYSDITEINNGNYHQSGRIIGHWFFNLSNDIGMEPAMKFSLDVIKAMPAGGISLEGFRETVIALSKSQFDFCSDEALAIRNALDAVCLGASGGGCETIDIGGSKIVCEENNSLNLFVASPVVGANYRWTFPIGWSVSGNPTGNHVNGTTLGVTNIPQYPYYPQNFNICVYSPHIGLNSQRCMRVTVRDCDGDDPTCEEYYGIGGKPSTPITNNAIKEFDSSNVYKEKAHLIRVFNFNGTLLYESLLDDFNENSFQRTDGVILVLAYYDKAGKLIKTKKKLIHNN